MHEGSRTLRLTGHIPGLDGVRGVAVLMVMAIHFIGGSTPHTTLQRIIVKTAAFGVLGVDLFFVLSGFLITGLLFESKGKPHYFRNFYARRTLRIFPLYYLVLALLFLVLPIFVKPTVNLEQARSHQAWLWLYVGNFYIASKSSWGALTYVNHFWSLAIEEHFYLLWPMIVFSFSRETLERICVGIVIAGLGLRIWLALAGMSELSISVLTPCRIDTLCVGALLALRVRREGGAERLVFAAGRIAFGLGCVLLALSLWCAIAKLGLPVLHQIRNSLYAFFFGALALTSLQPATALGKLFGSRQLRYFGKYSYGLYVYHGVLTWYMHETHVEERLDSLLGNHALTMLARAVIGFSISVLVAVLSFELLEKRFLQLKRFFETEQPALLEPSQRVQ